MLPTEFIKLNAAIKAAGAIPMRYFGQQLKLTHKSTSADFRTQADVETEQAIIQAIEELFPDYNIIAEEHGNIDKGSAYSFIIDPLDGTHNFVLGIPAFTSSIALMHEQEIIYGIINHPVTGNLYYAMRNQGAFLNDAPIKVNSENRHQHSTVSFCCSYTFSKQRIINFKNKLFDLDISRCLELWSPAFCFCNLACGKIEAIINDGLELYDFAAGKLIAIEAGAKVTDFSGNAFSDDTTNQFVITNGTDIHACLVNNVTSAF